MTNHHILRNQSRNRRFSVTALTFLLLLTTFHIQSAQAAANFVLQVDNNSDQTLIIKDVWVKFGGGKWEKTPPASTGDTNYHPGDCGMRQRKFEYERPAAHQCDHSGHNVRKGRYRAYFQKYNLLGECNGTRVEWWVDYTLGGGEKKTARASRSSHSTGVDGGLCQSWFGVGQFRGVSLAGKSIDSGNYNSFLKTEDADGTFVTKISRMFNWGPDKVFLFSGDQYWRYTVGKSEPDPHYPRNVSAWKLPSGYHGATFAWGDEHVYFFDSHKPTEYIRYTVGNEEPDAGYPKSIDDWNFPESFHTKYGSGESKVVAVPWGDKHVYFLNDKGDSVRYTVGTNFKPDPGYPKSISNWNFPVNWYDTPVRGGIRWREDTVFVFHDNSYIAYDIESHYPLAQKPNLEWRLKRPYTN